jgi:hypothetical protein
MRTQKGLKLVEALPILMVVIIIGDVGCSRQEAGKGPGNAAAASEPGATQIQQQRSRPEKIDKTAEQIQQQKGQPEKRDETADWITYVSSKGKFSLRRPKYWAVGPTRPQYCTDPSAFFTAGAEADLVAECATEYDGQILVFSEEGNQLNSYRLAASLYPHQNLTSRKVTVDKIEGTRDSGTAMGQDDERFGMPGLPDLTKVVIYSFYAYGRTYVAQYNQRIDDPDILPDFDLMVTKTLRFSQ